jgi:hypothetical protein
MLPSSEELRERYATWSDRKLLSVILFKGQYTAEAVEIARKELGHRRITAHDIDMFLYEQEEKRRREEQSSEVSLSFWSKLRCFFLWFLPAQATGGGFILKEQQSQFYSVTGFVSFFTNAFVVVYFRLPAEAGLAIQAVLFLLFLLFEKGWKWRNVA